MNQDDAKEKVKLDLEILGLYINDQNSLRKWLKLAAGAFLLTNSMSTRFMDELRSWLAKTH